MKRGYPGPEGSLPSGSGRDQPVADRARDGHPRPEAPPWDDQWTYRFLRARANSIEGGTTEILKNIIAERVLGLPRMR